MLELYSAYGDYNELMDFTEEMLIAAAGTVCDGKNIQYGDKEINLAQPWKRIRMIDAIKLVTGIDFSSLNFEEAIKAANKLGVETKELESRGYVINEVFETLVEPTFMASHFYY